MIARFFLVLGLSFLTACSVSSEHKTDTTTVNEGKTAEEFFNQFLFEKVAGNYRMVSTSDSALYLKLNDDGTRRALLTLKLYSVEQSAGTRAYEAKYEEVKDFKYTSLGSEHSSDQSKRIEGTWSIEDGQIVLSGLGRGSALTYNGSPAIALKLTHDIISPVTGKVMTLQIYYSPKGDF